MSVFARRLKGCRESIKKENPKFTQDYVAKKIGVARTTYTAYENGTKVPPLDTVNIIADFFGVTTDYLLGRTELKIHTVDDEKRLYEMMNDRDVAKRMKELTDDLMSAEGLAFDGEPISDEAKESLLEAMEFAVRTAKKINKKYTPKQYRDEE